MPRICPRLAIAFSPFTSSKILKQNDQWVSEMAKNGIHEINMYRTLFYFSVFVLCFTPATSERLTIATVSVVGLTLMSYSVYKLYGLAKTVDEVISTNFKIGWFGLERTHILPTYGSTGTAPSLVERLAGAASGVADYGSTGTAPSLVETLAGAASGVADYGSTGTAPSLVETLAGAASGVADNKA